LKPVIRSVGVWGYPNIRTWEPDDPSAFAELVQLDVGPKQAKGADSFSLRVATPAGLEALETKDGIVATRPLLVMRRYDYDDLWRWLETCEAGTWPECVEKLQRYFNWEFEGYQER
jgi:hypothetical protein